MMKYKRFACETRANAGGNGVKNHVVAAMLVVVAGGATK